MKHECGLQSGALAHGIMPCLAANLSTVKMGRKNELSRLPAKWGHSSADDSARGVFLVWALRQNGVEGEIPRMNILSKQYDSRPFRELQEEALRKRHNRRRFRELRDTHMLIHCRLDYLEACRKWLYGDAEK